MARTRLVVTVLAGALVMAGPSGAQMSGAQAPPAPGSPAYDSLRQLDQVLKDPTQDGHPRPDEVRRRHCQELVRICLDDRVGRTDAVGQPDCRAACVTPEPACR